MVVLDGRPATRQAVRRAAILAGAARASLAAVVIETSVEDRPSGELATGLQDNTRYAADLGAEIIRYAAADLVDGLEHVARSRRITHLFLTHRPRSRLLRWARLPLPEILADKLPELEIHIVGGPPAQADAGVRT